MDLVRDYQAAFKRAQQQPDINMDELLPVIKQHGRDPEDSSTWRWDVMRSVVSEDMKYVKLVTATELRFCYEQEKIVLQKQPETLNVIAMLLHAQYENYNTLIDVVDIQKEVFGSDLFEAIESQTIKLLQKRIEKMMLTTYESEDVVSVAKNTYSYYEEKFKNYYYWPHIKAVMDKTLASLE